MSKRTRKDEKMLESIQKLIKQDEEGVGTEKLKVSLVSLSDRELDDLVQTIEKDVVATFAKYPKMTFVSFSAWTEVFGTDKEKKSFDCVADVFKHVVPYILWLRDYRVLVTKDSSAVYQRFANDWFKAEISRFLAAIVTAWNKSHSVFTMSWSKKDPFDLRIDKRE